MFLLRYDIGLCNPYTYTHQPTPPHPRKHSHTITRVPVYPPQTRYHSHILPSFARLTYHRKQPATYLTLQLLPTRKSPPSSPKQTLHLIHFRPHTARNSDRPTIDIDHRISGLSSPSEQNRCLLIAAARLAYFPSRSRFFEADSQSVTQHRQPDTIASHRVASFNQIRQPVAESSTP